MIVGIHLHGVIGVFFILYKFGDSFFDEGCAEIQKVK